MSPFTGLSAFPVTPLHETGVALDAFQEIVSALAATDVSTIGALGSTGLYPYLSVSARSEAYAASVAAAGKTPVLAGIGALILSDVLASAEAAERAGCAGLLLAPVSYLPLSDDEVVGLFEAVSDASGLPILIYNNPGTTGVSISEELVGRLASIDRVKGMKNPSNPEGGAAAQIARLRGQVPPDFSLGYSGDASISGAIESGADAWYSVLAGTLPDVALRLWKNRNDTSRLTAETKRLEPLWALFNRFGSIRVIYEVARLEGKSNLGLPLPLLPLPKDAVAQIAQALETLEQLEVQ